VFSTMEATVFAFGNLKAIEVMQREGRTGEYAVSANKALRECVDGKEWFDAGIIPTVTQAIILLVQAHNLKEQKKESPYDRVCYMRSTFESGIENGTWFKNEATGEEYLRLGADSNDGWDFRSNRDNWAAHTNKCIDSIVKKNKIEVGAINELVRYATASEEIWTELRLVKNMHKANELEGMKKAKKQKKGDKEKVHVFDLKKISTAFNKGLGGSGTMALLKGLTERRIAMSDIKYRAWEMIGNNCVKELICNHMMYDMKTTLADGEELKEYTSVEEEGRESYEELVEKFPMCFSEKAIEGLVSSCTLHGGVTGVRAFTKREMENVKRAMCKQFTGLDHRIRGVITMARSLRDTGEGGGGGVEEGSEVIFEEDLKLGRCVRATFLVGNVVTGDIGGGCFAGKLKAMVAHLPEEMDAQQFGFLVLNAKKLGTKEGYALAVCY
jgi:hypothetical protein